MELLLSLSPTPTRPYNCQSLRRDASLSIFHSLLNGRLVGAVGETISLFPLVLLLYFPKAASANCILLLH